MRLVSVLLLSAVLNDRWPSFVTLIKVGSTCHPRPPSSPKNDDGDPNMISLSPWRPARSRRIVTRVHSRGSICLNRALLPRISIAWSRENCKYELTREAAAGGSAMAKQRKLTLVPLPQWPFAQTAEFGKLEEEYSSRRWKFCVAQKKQEDFTGNNRRGRDLGIICFATRSRHQEGQFNYPSGYIMVRFGCVVHRVVCYDQLDPRYIPIEACRHRTGLATFTGFSSVRNKHQPESKICRDEDSATSYQWWGDS
jgi:hypothetical protein